MIAINDMGTLYRLGRGVAQDFSTAAMLHLLAAAEGDSMAIASLTDCLPELERLLSMAASRPASRWRRCTTEVWGYTRRGDGSRMGAVGQVAHHTRR